MVYFSSYLLLLFCTLVIGWTPNWSNPDLLQFDFKDKVIFMTGADTEFGTELVRYFSLLNARFALVGYNEEKLNSLANEIATNTGTRPYTICGDIRNDDFCRKAVFDALTHVYKINVFLHIAGYIDDQIDICDHRLDIFDELIAVNVRAAIVLMQALYQELENRRGNIVFVSSVTAQVAFKLCPMYSAAKAGVDAMTVNAAAEFHSMNIRVNCVNPGYIRRPNLDPRIRGEAKISPMSEYGTYIDVTNAIAYMASDMADFVTGATLTVDGGSLVGGEMEKCIAEELDRLQEMQRNRLSPVHNHPDGQHGRSELIDFVRYSLGLSREFTFKLN